ncbi:hypothetical protein IGL24_002567 [Enterococcus sp. DIV2371]|uniref:XRE family transcriptional regulator n=1 Tax=Enterococcus sp. DIV2371 TaxID=2774927 RepID=UPI003D2A4143
MGRPTLNNFEKKLREDISNNLKRITKGKTQAQISEITGIPTSTISGYFAKRSTIKEENLIKIAKAFNVDKSDIDPRYSREYNYLNLKKEVLDGLQENNENFVSEKFEELAKKANETGMNLTRTKTDRGKIMSILSSDIQEYNFFDTSVAAGVPTSVEAFDKDYIEQIAIPDCAMGKYAGYQEIFFTKINGDSMNNVIPNGSLIAVKKINSCEELKDEDIVVFSNDNEFSVKRYINDEQNKRIIFRPDSDNISFTDIVVNYEDTKTLQIYGKVVVYIVHM